MLSKDQPAVGFVSSTLGFGDACIRAGGWRSVVGHFGGEEWTWPELGIAEGIKLLR